MSKPVLPIVRHPNIFNNRRNRIVGFEFSNKLTGQAINLTSYIFVGSVYDKIGGTKLADLDLSDSDLAEGQVFAYLSLADSQAIVAAALAANPELETVVWDIKATPTGGEPVQWFSGTGVIQEVATP
jgi:hypothetical protein